MSHCIQFDENLVYFKVEMSTDGQVYSFFYWLEVVFFLFTK